MSFRVSETEDNEQGNECKYLTGKDIIEVKQTVVLLKLPKSKTKQNLGGNSSFKFHIQYEDTFIQKMRNTNHEKTFSVSKGDRWDVCRKRRTRVGG